VDVDSLGKKAMDSGDDGREVVEAYYRTMQARGIDEENIVSLFADHAVYIEPFSAGTVSGEKRTHEGKDAIREFFRESWNHRPPDMRLELDRVSLEGDMVRADWTCSAQAFETPMIGFDVYLVRRGKIVRLETTVTQPPNVVTWQSERG
jgi:predicted SnoaL-like aldol condensation-catalyzing enzyme